MRRLAQGHQEETGIEPAVKPGLPPELHYGAFPPQGAGRFSPLKVRYGSRFQRRKVGVTRTEPHSEHAEYSSVGVLRP